MDEKCFRDKGDQLMEMLTAALGELEKAGPEGMSDYRAYLHGQIYGLATALKILYPGPGNLGEKAALALRPAITEHSCKCKDED